MSDNAMIEKMRKKQLQHGGGTVPPAQPAPKAQDGPRPAPRGKGGPRYPEFRLPHGAAFNASYDALAKRWTVVLTVPGLPPMQTVASGVHAAMIQLGRRWFAEHGTLDKGAN